MTLSDVLPAGVTLVSVQPSQGSCAGTSTISCSLGTLAAGENAMVVIQAIPNTAGNITDTANVTSGVADPDTTNNDASVTVGVINLPGEADLALSLGADPDPVEAGQILTYFVNVSNFGPSDAIGVVLSDVLPAGVSLVLVSPSQGSCAEPQPFPAPGYGRDGSGRFRRDPGDSKHAGQPHRHGQRDQRRARSRYQQQRRRGHRHRAGPGGRPRAHPGGQSASGAGGAGSDLYLERLNSGPSDANGVELSDVLPAGVILVSVIPSQGSWRDHNHFLLPGYGGGGRRRFRRDPGPSRPGGHSSPTPRA